MKIEDIKRKGEGLLEQGETLKQRRAQCAQRVASAAADLAAARAAMNAALEKTDEDGNPTGDVSGAQARVGAMQSALSAAEAELRSVTDAIERIEREKLDAVSELGRYNEAERRNLSVLEQLQRQRFGGNVSAFIADLVARMNAGEEMRDRLLQSIGQSGEGRRYSAGAAGGAGNDGDGSGGLFGFGAKKTSFRKQDPKQMEAFEAYQQALSKIYGATLSPEKRSEALAALDLQFYALARKKGWAPDASAGNYLREIGVVLPNHVSMTRSYGNTLLQRYHAGVPAAKAALEKFGPQLRVVDDAFNVRGAANHFMPRPGFLCKRQPDGTLFVQYEERGVHMNAAADAASPKGVGTTFFHEIGHMLDDTIFASEGTTMSDNEQFQTALQEDYQAFRAFYDAQDDQWKQKFSQKLFQDRMHSLSDLLGGLSGGEIQGKYLHSPDYWARSSSLIYKEAIAHFFEASMGAEDKQKVFSQYFPRAQTVFYDMLSGNPAPKVKRYVRKR